MREKQQLCHAEGRGQRAEGSIRVVTVNRRVFDRRDGTKAEAREASSGRSTLARLWPLNTTLVGQTLAHAH